MTDVPPARGLTGASLDPRYTGDAPLLGALYSTHATSVGTPAAETTAPLIHDGPSVQISSRNASLDPGQKITVSLTPLSGGAVILTGSMGTFVIGPDITLPDTIRQAGTALGLVINRDGASILANIVDAGSTPLKSAIPVELSRLQPGTQFQAAQAGTDSLGRTLFSTPIGSFALTSSELSRLAGPAGNPPERLTISVTQVGTDIHGSIIGADRHILDQPLTIALARTPIGIPFEAHIAGTDTAGRQILATPFGVFLTQTASENSTPQGTERLTLVLRGNDGGIKADIIARNGISLAAPLALTLTLAEGDAPLDAASTKTQPRIIPSLTPDQARAVAESLGTSWPALAGAVTKLALIDPALASKVLAAMPQIGPKLAAQVLGVLAAIQSGKASALIGADAVAALREAGHGALADQIEDDLHRLNRLAHQSDAEWRPVLMPFYDGQNLHQIGLMIGRPPEHEAGSGDPGTRFVLSVDFTNLGAVQLDGFVQAQQRRFDVTLRSRMSLDGEVKSQAQTRFSDALTAAGFSGRLMFQVVNPFPVPIPEGLGKVSGVSLTGKMRHPDGK